MISFIIYLIGVLDNILYFVGICLVGLGIGIVLISLGYCIAYVDGGAEEATPYKKTVKNFVIAFIIAGLFVSFTPSSKTVAAMYLIPKIANNEMINQIPEKALNVLNKKLDSWLEEDKK